MTNLVKKYRGKSYRDIEWGLRYQKTPEPIIEQTLIQLKAERAALTRHKLSSRKINAAWAEIIEALQHERRIVRSMLRYKTAEPAPERDDFVAQYAYALNELYARLAKYRRDGERPKHSHWSDFVPLKVKDAFIEAVNSIPTRSRARIKVPFERRLPYAIYDRRKARLLRSTRSELHTMEAKGATEYVDKLKEAIDIINAIPLGDHIPNTWHEVMRDEDTED